MSIYLILFPTIQGNSRIHACILCFLIYFKARFQFFCVRPIFRFRKTPKNGPLCSFKRSWQILRGQDLRGRILLTSIYSAGVVNAIVVLPPAYEITCSIVIFRRYLHNSTIPSWNVSAVKSRNRLLE
jgi:hypothetical protein